MNTADITWAAGLYEGEGSVNRGKNNGAIQVRISMVDREPLDRIAAILGGRVSGPYTPRNPNHSPFYIWIISNWIEAPKALKLIRPWLSKRRKEQIDVALSDPASPAARLTATGPQGRKCPQEPIPSSAGFLRHRRLGESPCAVCLESKRLYHRQYMRKHRTKN